MVIIYIQNSSSCKENVQFCVNVLTEPWCMAEYIYHLEYWLSDVNECVCSVIKV